jgi:hypothetical protein
MRAIRILATCAAAITSTAAFAGVTLKMEGDFQHVLYLQGNKMRFESTAQSVPGETVVIFDGDAMQLIMISPPEKTYSVMTRETIKEMNKQRDEAMAKLTPEQRKQMEEMMAKMPPEQRKQMEQMMSGGGAKSTTENRKKAANLKWEPTGQKETVAGFRCDGFKELREGKLHARGCFIPWSAGAMTKGDMAPFAKLEDMFAEFGLGAFSGQALIGYEKLPGFPGKWTPVSGGGEGQPGHTLSSLQRGNLSADKFAIPAGYKKTDPMQGTH